MLRALGGLGEMRMGRRWIDWELGDGLWWLDFGGEARDCVIEPLGQSFEHPVCTERRLGIESSGQFMIQQTNWNLKVYRKGASEGKEGEGFQGGNSEGRG